MELFRESRTEGENTLLSPLFVAMALGMTANGATGETLDEFAALFGMDSAALNALRAQMFTGYRKLGGSTESTLANSLWYDRPFVYGIVDMETEALLFLGTAERLE